MRQSLLPSLKDRKLGLCLLSGALAGMAIAVQVLDPQFIAGTGGKWIRPENDYNAYLVAWNYYVIDKWRFPLFDLPAMGYPEGGSVLFNDALPITAIPTKLLYHWTGTRVNPFGWWIFLTYVLQGAMAARLVCALGVRSIWACTTAAVLAIVNTAFSSRMVHTALSSHFLLLWVLALHFESVRRERARIGELMAVLAVALLVNSYLFAMVFAFEVATIAPLALRGQLHRRDLGVAAVGVVLVAALGIASGYGVFFTNPVTMKSQGFGLYSWNLVGLLLPPDGIFGFLAGVPRDGTHGQYEGEAYLGRGALLLLALCLVFTPVKVVQHARRYWVYVAMLLAFALYAASNVVYVSDILMVQYPLPQAVIDLGNYFRATGRFIWPLAYSLAILPVACIFRWWHPALAVAAAAIAVVLQCQEGSPGLQHRRVQTSQTYEELIDTPTVSSWLAQHERLWQYPSWACGGLAGAKRSWGNREANRELQVQLAAARAGIPTNSVYTSRLLKNCPIEFNWLANPQLEEGVLYLFAPDTVQASPALSNLARSKACLRLDWAVVCSQNWATTSVEHDSLPTVRK
jgi:hypothetical protein